jgi:hypothetical protein
VYPIHELDWLSPDYRWVRIECPACGAVTSNLVNRGYAPDDTAFGRAFEHSTTRLQCCDRWVEVAPPRKAQMTLGEEGA